MTFASFARFSASSCTTPFASLKTIVTADRDHRGALGEAPQQRRVVYLAGCQPAPRVQGVFDVSLRNGRFCGTIGLKRDIAPGLWNGPVFPTKKSVT
jgi:hypothetical protein